MGIQVMYEVVEHFDGDNAPEPFGDYLASGKIIKGDVITLKWLDGRNAYDVQVFDIMGGTLHVRAVPKAGKDNGV